MIHSSDCFACAGSFTPYLEGDFSWRKSPLPHHQPRREASGARAHSVVRLARAACSNVAESAKSLPAKGLAVAADPATERASRTGRAAGNWGCGTSGAASPVRDPPRGASSRRIAIWACARRIEGGIMSGMVGGMAAPTATALAARTSGGASPSARRAPSRYQGFDPLNRRLAAGSRRPRARTAPVIAVAGSTSPAPDGRPRTASSSPVPAPRSSPPRSPTLAPSPLRMSFTDARPSWAERRRRRRAAAPRGSRATRTTSSLLTRTAFDRVGPSPSSSSPSLRSPPPTPSPWTPRRLTSSCTKPWWTASSPQRRRAPPRAPRRWPRRPRRRVSHKNFLRQCARRGLWRSPSSLSSLSTTRRAPLQHAPLGVCRRGRLAIPIRRLRAHARRRRRARLQGLHHPDQRVRQSRRVGEGFRDVSKDGDGRRVSSCRRTAR